MIGWPAEKSDRLTTAQMPPCCYGATSARLGANPAAGGHRYLILAPATTSIEWKSSARVFGRSALLISPRAL